MPPVPGDEFVVLVPGSGFPGATAQPAAVGTPDMPGYDAKAIARWDVVPFQTFTGDFHIGVVAFHMNGIDRVDFSVNGGPWASVYEMQLNPDTDVWEYTALLRAEDFPDGPVEVRAIAWPSGAGEPRVLGGEISAASAKHGGHSLLLAANSTGSLGGPPRWVDPDNGDDSLDGLSAASAVRTLRAAVQRIQQSKGALDGGTVYLMPGDHDWMCFSGAVGNNSFASIRFEAMPGASAGAVRIVDRHDVTGNAPRILFVDFAGVTVEQTIRDTTYAGSGENRLWFDNCHFDAGSLTASLSMWNSVEWERGVYLTNSTIAMGRVAVSGAHLARNVLVEHCGEDAFKNVAFIVNAQVNVLTQADPSYHPDVVQYLGAWQNTIVYGLSATNYQAQSIFSREPVSRHDDVAFVNINLEPVSGAYLGQWLRNTNHLLVWHWTSQSPFWFRAINPGDGALLTVTNLSIKNSVFASVSYPSDRYPSHGLAFSNNHFVSGTVFGLAATSGAVDGTPGSRVIDGRVFAESLVVPVDLLGRRLIVPGSVGALQPTAAAGQ